MTTQITVRLPEDLAAVLESVVPMDIGGGVEVPVASLLDVIRSKEAAGRDKDHRALPVLRQLLERLDEQH